MSRITLTAALVMVATLSGATKPVSAEAVPTVTTDKADYEPQETVTVSAAGLSPGVAYDVPVIRPNGDIVKGDGSFSPGFDTLTADGSGAFTYLYKLNGVVGEYEVRVYLSPWNENRDEVPIARTTFTDAVSLQQCANLADGCTTSSSWVTAGLTASNSQYYEGSSVPYRLRLTGLATPLTAMSATISWNTTISGRNATDYLTSFNRSEGTANACAGTCTGATFTTKAIPTDPNVAVTKPPGVFTLYNGTIDSLSPYSYSVVGTANRTSITIFFTPTSTSAVLAWGGHLASQLQWGEGTTITTAPAPKPSYQMRLTHFNGALNVQERTLAAGSVQRDSTPPLCELTSRTWSTLEVTAEDTEIGLATIAVAKQTNMTVTIPAFPGGTNDPQVVTANKKDLSKSSSLTLRVTDVAGNVTICDPVMTTVVRSSGRPVTETFTELPENEHFVTVYNRDPGITSLLVKVNGTEFAMDDLRAGEVRLISVAAAMVPGDVNTISLTAAGKPGGRADIIISD